MFNNKKVSSGALLVAGLAAYAYYKYSKMSEEEKKNIVEDLKVKGQKLYDQHVPQELKDLFAKKAPKESDFESEKNFTM